MQDIKSLHVCRYAADAIYALLKQIDFQRSMSKEGKLLDKYLLNAILIVKTTVDELEVRREGESTTEVATVATALKKKLATRQVRQGGIKCSEIGVSIDQDFETAINEKVSGVGDWCQR
jgi:hypothetical protein